MKKLYTIELSNQSTLKYFIFTLCFSFISSFIFAQKVSLQDAKTFAEKFCNSNIHSQSKGTPVINYQSCKTIDNSDTSFYIFSINKKGFIIVSADSSAFPILAYSDESNFDESQQSPEFNFWIKNYTDQISLIKKQKNISKNSSWNNSFKFNQTKGNTKAITPLLTSKWDQGTGYNYLCPLHSNGISGKCVTGCIATAMAQIMYYYKYPKKGFNYHDYYHPYYGKLECNFDTLFFDWQSMTDSINATSLLPIAKLMYACGVSVDMYYTPIESSSTVDKASNALYKYFDFSIRLKQVARSDYNSDYDWNNLLMQELDKKVPVLYSGQNPANSTDGHVWLCDGYKDSCFFHFNWGWGGQGNGYYYVSKLNPLSNDFSSEQGAIIDIFPYNFPYCQSLINISNSTGTLDDGSGPSSYWNNTNCEWLIVNPDSSKIDIDFNYFRTEQDKDILTIYDGDNTSAPVLGQYSGHINPASIESSRNKILLQFVSDSVNQDDGWEIKYTSKTLGVNSYSVNDKIELFPNPTNDFLKILIPANSKNDYTLNVFNNLGSLVLTENIEINQSRKYFIDVHHLNAGIYYCQLINNHSVIYKKFIKQ